MCGKRVQFRDGQDVLCGASVGPLVPAPQRARAPVTLTRKPSLPTARLARTCKEHLLCKNIDWETTNSQEHAPWPGPHAFRDNVQGTEVYGSDGKNIGEIDHLIIESKVSGRVAYAVMSFGGFMNCGTAIIQFRGRPSRPRVARHSSPRRRQLREYPGHFHIIGAHRHHFGAPHYWDMRAGV